MTREPSVLLPNQACRWASITSALVTRLPDHMGMEPCGQSCHAEGTQEGASMRPSSSEMSCRCVASGPSPGQHFYGSGMPRGAGPHPAEPQGPGQMAAGKAGSEPQAWLWKSGNEWPTGGSIPTGTSRQGWHGPVPNPAVAHGT